MDRFVCCTVLALALAFVATPANADLPIHCLNSEVAGHWEFELTPDDSDAHQNCGYGVPDSNKQHFENPDDFEFDFTDRMTVELKEPNIAIDSDGNKGKWTMIYDEGFEVRVGGKRYFAFSAYKPKSGTQLSSEEVDDYISMCGKTLVGWYHEDDAIEAQNWGCWRGSKKSSNDDSSNSNDGNDGLFDNDDKKPRKKHRDYIVSPSSGAATVDGQALDFQSPPEQPMDAVPGDFSNMDDGMLPPADDMLEPDMPGSNFAFRQTNMQVVPRNQGRAYPVMARQPMQQQQFYPQQPMYQQPPAAGNAYPPPGSSYPPPMAMPSYPPMAQPRYSQMNPFGPTPTINNNMMFEPNLALVETVNGDSGSTWQATVHKQFIGNTVQHMRNLLGVRGGMSMGRHRQDSPGAVIDDRPDEVKYDGLPESFDWRDVDGQSFDTPVRDQGSCGSCYIFATTYVAESRVRILTQKEDEPTISAQHVSSCSNYNQGCDGGYPFLAAKHGQDFGFVREECMPYEGTDTECPASCPRIRSDDKENRKRYFVEDYGYIGGYYGHCSEVEMMKEIKKNGPIMVAFEAPGSLFYYKGGIFTGEPPEMEKQKGNINQDVLHPWEKTNHAVVAMGWGVEDGEKYWIIKNTWGKDWGEDGFFRIRRGSDECGIESMAVFMNMKKP